MSAPTSHDPRFVNTKDACWVRRAVTSDGRGLYAAAGSCQCPEFLLVPLSELAEHGIVRSADALPMPVAPEPQASAGGYPPALPWAALMDDDDLAEFLNELGEAAIRSLDPREALAEVERACSTWRLIGEAQHGHNTAPGPDERPVNGLTAVYMPVASLREPEGELPLKGRARLDASAAAAAEATHWKRLGITEPEGEFYPTVHHAYRPGLGRDLPETGGEVRG